MSVYVTDFSITPWAVVHDDAPGGAHEGTVDPAAVGYTQNLDGSHNHNYAAVTCPVCGATSTHPVGGGAQPPLVQKLFCYLAESDGCPCPADMPDGMPLQLAAGHVKQHCEQMDGVGRWQVAA